jgi:hypothetical protein
VGVAVGPPCRPLPHKHTTTNNAHPLSGPAVAIPAEEEDGRCLSRPRGKLGDDQAATAPHPATLLVIMHAPQMLGCACKLAVAC